MSDNDLNNIVTPKFGTTTIQTPGLKPGVGPTPEQLKELHDKGSSQVFELIQKNRQMGLANLQRASDSLETMFDDIRRSTNDPVFLKRNEKDKVFFNLEESLKIVKRGIEGALTSVEAINSLMDMLIHDLGGQVFNLNETQKGMLIANSHLQTLIELLKRKGAITELEMEAMWNELVKQKQEEFRDGTSSDQ